MAQICEFCKHKKEPCYCSPNSTCDKYEKDNSELFSESNETFIEFIKNQKK